MPALPDKEVHAFRRSEFPLSFAQQRLWFLEQLGGTGPSYTLAHALLLRGPLDVYVLNKAVQHVVSRHPSLRTTFEMVDDEPVQVIAPRLVLDVPVVDLSEWSEPEQLAEARRSVNEEARRPFDLKSGPLLRVLVLKLNSREHVLTLCTHHIVTDGWSMGIFFRELSTSYNSYLRGRDPKLPALTHQYTDYVAWQREWLSGDLLESLTAYWKKHLDGAPSAIELPQDRLRPAVQSHRGARITRRISAEHLASLKLIARRQGCTLFMTLLAAFHVLLFRYTGQSDLVIGSPIAGRTRREHERIIGFFANTLLFRVALEEDLSFEQALQRVRDTSLDAYAHQELPFEHLVKVLKPDRDPSRSPLFQVLFAFQNASRPALDLNDIEVSRLDADTGAARFDLSLKTMEREGALTAVFEYNSDLFDRRTIERMAVHFEVLLEGIVENPRQSVSKLPLLTAGERRRLLIEWNQTATEFPRDASIHQLYEEQAARTPDAVAVISGDRQLSYSELNLRANRLSRYLRRQGIGSEDVVGLYMNRCPEMIVGLLGILKAQATYLPLNPDDPPVRTAFMLDDAGVNLILSDQSQFSGSPVHGRQTVCLDSDWDAIGVESADNLNCEVNGDHLAYIMYTSGSTGGPKGVAVPHRGAVRLVKGAIHFNLSANQVFLQLAPLSFDASTFEIWGCLLNGGRLVLYEPETLSLEALAETIARYGVTTLWLTAGLFNLLANDRIGELKSVRQLLAGGDVLPVAQVRKALEALPECQLINGYGPTENTTFTCCYRIPESVRADKSIPIGRPIANTEVYILDSHMQPVPIGVPGELYAGGAGLARGYLNQPELTAKAFVPNPFSEAPGARLYKTGDLARYLADGNIEFLGRIDDQVKIRGYRVEPKEVEYALARHSKVKESVVLAQEDIPGEKRLVAYVVPTEEQIPSLDELRSLLKQTLPVYMVPSAFVPVDALPLTRNGKVDRRALIRLSQGRQTDEAYVAPYTSTERKLAEIWKKMLWLDHDVGIHDNFFDLGGHSLLSVQLVAEIEDVFEKSLPIVALFRLSTIAELAAALDSNEPFEDPGNDSSFAPVLAPEIYHQLLALTAGWQGKRIGPRALTFGLNTKGSKQPLFWCLQGFRELSQLARYLGADQPTYGMRSGHLVMKYTPANVEALAYHYVEEILTVEPDGPYLIGGNCQAAIIAFEMAEQLQARGKVVTLLCNLERFVPRLYEGKRAVFFGRESEFHPHKLFQSPELGWRKFCPRGVTMDTVPGSHGQFFNEPNIQVLAEKLSQRIEEAQRAVTNPLPHDAVDGILSDRSYRAKLVAQSELVIGTGRTWALPVNVTNGSAELWRRTEQSGILLGNHWLNENEQVVQWLDGHSGLPDDLAPGASVEIVLPVTAPGRAGRYVLELDLVEEGIAWFKKKGSETTKVKVLVSDESNESTSV